MSAGKVVLVVTSVVMLVVAALSATGGAALLWANVAARDSDGYYSMPWTRFDSGSYAITSDALSKADNRAHRGWFPFNLGTARVIATPVGPKPIFLGVGKTDDVTEYLRNVAHDSVADISDSQHVSYEHLTGAGSVTDPQLSSFWIAQSTGNDSQAIQWDVGRGNWTIVAMNADGTSGVDVNAKVGLRTDALLPAGIVLLTVAAVLAAVATGLLMTLRRREEKASSPPRVPVETRGYPLHFRGELDQRLSRGLWLVKWFLAIPHVIVLAFLWVAFTVAAVISGFSILFTGRYPRRLFDFNVGVMRWTWRVTFYAMTLGTDRYPPFALAADATYPADLDVAYPSQLSRPAVLVKWWLLAIPHYVIVSIFGGGIAYWTWSGAGDTAQNVAGLGLTGVLAVVAGISLLFRQNYPESVFDFIMGMERWTFRVMTYVSLMTDHYPPFRLDAGPNDASEPDPLGTEHKEAA